MANLKAGTLIGGNLIWDAGNLPLRVIDDNLFIKESQVYTTKFKPTPADVNAVAKTGDTMTGNLTIDKLQPEIWLYGGSNQENSGRIYFVEGSGKEHGGWMGYDGKTNLMMYGHRANGVDSVVFQHAYNSNTVTFLGSVLTSAAQSTNVAAFTRKDYVDQQVATRVALAGSTMTGKLILGYPSAVKLPAGTTAQRGTGVAGDFRFNTDEKGYEGHDGSEWQPIGSGRVAFKMFSANFTASKGKGHLVDTRNAGIVVTLPAGVSDSDFVVIGDGSKNASKNPFYVAGFNGDRVIVDRDNCILRFSYVGTKWVIIDGIGESGALDSAEYLKISGGTLIGDLRMSPDKMIVFPTTTYASGAKIYSVNADQYGANLVLTSGGATILGAGESATSVASEMAKTSENAFISADGEIQFITGANTWANRKVAKITSSGRLYLEDGASVTRDGKTVTMSTGSSDAFIHNSKSNKYLQLKDDGTLMYSNAKVYHSDAKPTASELGVISTSSTAHQTISSTGNSGLRFDTTRDSSDTGLIFCRNGKTRWNFWMNNSAESTDNAGSNLVLRAYDDEGKSLSDVFSVYRNSSVLRFGKTPTVAGTPMIKQFDYGVGSVNNDGRVPDAVEYTEGKVRDFNALITSGEYTISGDWANGTGNVPEVKSHTGFVVVHVRKFTAGPAVVQRYYFGINAANGDGSDYMERSATGQFPNQTWSRWRRNGNWEHNLAYRMTIERSGDTAYPYITLHKRDYRTDIAATSWYTANAVQMKDGPMSDANNPDSGKTGLLFAMQKKGDNTENRVLIQCRDPNGSTKNEFIMYQEYTGSGKRLHAPSIGIYNTSSESGNGLSLYSGSVSGKPTYGMMFAGTGKFGKHGDVQGDWATYLTMSGAINRGWIFKHDDTNVASISSNGSMYLNSSLITAGNLNSVHASNPLIELHTPGKWAGMMWLDSSSGELNLAQSNGANGEARRLAAWTLGTSAMRNYGSIAIPSASCSWGTWSSAGGIVPLHEEVRLNVGEWHPLLISPTYIHHTQGYAGRWSIGHYRASDNRNGDFVINMTGDGYLRNNQRFHFNDIGQLTSTGTHDGGYWTAHSSGFDCSRIGGNIIDWAVAAFVHQSDKNKKRNIKPAVKSALDDVMQIKFKSYDWNEDANVVRSNLNKHTNIGLLAQDMEELDPAYTRDMETFNPDGSIEESIKALDMTNCLSLALKAIQEQQNQIATLKARIELLESGK